MSKESDVALSLVIPAYNEASIIVRNLGELQAFMGREMPETRYEIVVVDDGSTDGMADLLKQHAETHPELQVSTHKYNQGRGKAIRTGFAAARGQYLICLDADLSYSPEHIPRLLGPLVADEADITLASAYHPDGTVTNVPFSRALMSRWGNRVLSVGIKSDVHTVTCVVRGYRRAAIEAMELINDGKDLHLEIIQKAELFGMRIVEVPAHLKWRDRSRDHRKKRSILGRLPFLSMSGTIASHLVYSYVLRPGTILSAPVAGLLSIALLCAVMLFLAFLDRVAHLDQFGLGYLFGAVRETLLQGELTFLVMIFSLVLSIIFLAFYFASQQNKKNHDELYVLLSRMNERIKHLEKNGKA
ncbi:MAG: glycosyltransferase family 2 protein [Roseitalea sp.]|jgi:glycosyltransferase involved in cell wall biosynthesis|nr:glycosyltransferase family 2 protein [Roseitalea sp.]MBO6722768.1 glycosyltransferase family 2 protein [Roseitalea sp.]MBO6745158.1 glycosyltransferase family 2 protein [Roseitalea sp.]